MEERRKGGWEIKRMEGRGGGAKEGRGREGGTERYGRGANKCRNTRYPKWIGYNENDRINAFKRKQVRAHHAEVCSQSADIKIAVQHLKYNWSIL